MDDNYCLICHILVPRHDPDQERTVQSVYHKSCLDKAKAREATREFCVGTKSTQEAVR